MRAIRLHEGSEMRVEDVPMPEAGAGEVLVQVQAAGVCGTDLHAAHGHLPVAQLPVTMGHEGAGIISAVGPGVDSDLEGARVLLLPSETCGQCAACRVGHLGLCAKAKIFGMARDGTFAEAIAAPASCAIPLPASVPFEHGAILADAVATACHAVATRGAITGGERVAVIGCGGVGYHAILIARLLGAERIVAVDASLGALDRALAAGADVAIDARDEGASKAIFQAAGSGGPHVVIEYVGRASTVELALGCVARGGSVVVGGVGMDAPRLPPLLSFVGREVSLLASMGYTRAELDQVVAWAASGELDLSKSITARYPLEDAPQAIDDLAHRRGDPVRLALFPKEQFAELPGDR